MICVIYLDWCLDPPLEDQKVYAPHLTCCLSPTLKPPVVNGTKHTMHTGHVGLIRMWYFCVQWRLTHWLKQGWHCPPHYVKQGFTCLEVNFIHFRATFFFVLCLVCFSQISCPASARSGLLGSVYEIDFSPPSCFCKSGACADELHPSSSAPFAPGLRIWNSFLRSTHRTRFDNAIFQFFKLGKAAYERKYVDRTSHNYIALPYF